MMVKVEVKERHPQLFIAMTTPQNGYIIFLTLHSVFVENWFTYDDNLRDKK